MEERKVFRIAETTKQEVESADASKILKTDILDSKDQVTEYVCTVRQLAYYIGARPSDKKAIVFNQKNPKPPEKSYFRYRTAIAARQLPRSFCNKGFDTTK